MRPQDAADVPLAVEHVVVVGIPRAAGAVVLLRAQVVDEGVIDEVYRLCGTPKPTQAEDSARHARAYWHKASFAALQCQGR